MGRCEPPLRHLGQTTRVPKVAIAGWIGSTNLGDEMLFAAAKRELEARGAEVVALSVRPAATTRAHRCEAVSAFRPDVMARTLRSCSSLLLVGGTVQESTSPFNLPFHSVPVRLAARRDRPVFGAGLGVEPITSTIGRRVARRMLAPLTDLTVRDGDSAAAVVALGLPRPTVTGDLAFLLPTESVDRLGRVAVAVRPWAGGSRLPAVASWQRGLGHDWFVSGMASALDEASRRSGSVTHFICFQPGRDDALHRAIAERMTTPVSHAAPDVDTVFREVGSSRALIAMRYHAAVTAIATKTPLVAFDTFAKVRSLVTEADRPMPLEWSPSGVVKLPAYLDVAVASDDSLAARSQENGRVFDAAVRA